MPVGEVRLDAVAKVEDLRVVRDVTGAPTEVILQRPLSAGENLRYRGADFRPGQRVVQAGSWLLPEQVLALAAIGVPAVSVRRRPRVALISTGRELVEAATPRLRPGAIRDATTPYLQAALPLYGASPEPCGTVPDDPAQFVALLEEVLAREPEVIVSTGAVSMGKHDFVPAALATLGARAHFHRVAIRPGKPLLVADWPGRPRGPVFFGIPGNPASTAVGLRFFLTPYLRALLGLPPERPMRLALSDAVEKPPGLRCFFKAHATTHASGGQVTVLAGQASFMVSPLLVANAWAVLPEEPTELRAGVEIDVFRQHPDVYDFASEPR
jgi:molybdopterin molybdotransferase